MHTVCKLVSWGLFWILEEKVNEGQGQLKLKQNVAKLLFEYLVFITVC